MYLWVPVTHFTLFELNQLVRRTLDAHLDPSYWVIAEIGDYRVNQKGHCYLELVQKEEDSVVAKVKGTIWSYTFRNLRTWFEGITGQSLQTGMKVLVNVTVQFHELYGFSLNIRDLDPNYTLGEKERKRKEIINQLKQEGLFDANKSSFLPLVPQRLAVISSPTAAGYGDFIDHLKSNPHGYGFHLQLFKALMQGEGATISIINALEKIGRNVPQFDVIIIIRGGGSQVELDCFDAYDLAVTIAKCEIPVITGIGHERDETITDMVAHTQLKTPTAVSEFLINGFSQFEANLNDFLVRLRLRYEQVIREQELVLNEKYHLVNQSVRSTINDLSGRVNAAEERLKVLSKRLIDSHYAFLEKTESTIRLNDPKVILNRGYTISYIDGKPINGSAGIEQGQEMMTRTLEVEISSIIQEVSR